MGSKLLFTLNSILAVVFGAALLIVPKLTIAWFGNEARVSDEHMGRFLGAALITLGALLWFAKDASDPSAQKGMSYAMLGGTVLALIVTITGIAMDGIIREFGWLAIVVEVVFGLGYVFVLFLQPRMN